MKPKQVDKMIEQLVSAGKLTRQETIDMVLDIKAELEQQKQDVEQKLNQGIADVLHSLQLPQKKQVAELEAALGRLEKRIQELEAKRRHT